MSVRESAPSEPSRDREGTVPTLRRRDESRTVIRRIGAGGYYGNDAPEGG
jgi:hypothetical protein